MRTIRWPCVVKVCLLVAAVGPLCGAQSAGPATPPVGADAGGSTTAPSSGAVTGPLSHTVGFIARTLETDGRATGKYQVWVPLDYTRARKWPVILFLHGADGCGTDGEKMLAQGLPQAIKKRNGKFDFIVVIPQCPSASGWRGSQEKTALAALAATFNEYACDRERLYLTGVSMGANATYALAAKYPLAFAAIAPVSGIGDVRSAKTIARIPTWIWHGEADKTIAADKARRMVDALQKADAVAVKYTELPDIGEEAWDQAYTGDDLWTWFLRYTCPERPAPTTPTDDGGFRKMDGKMENKFEKGKFRKMDGKMEPMNPH